MNNFEDRGEYDEFHLNLTRGAADEVDTFPFSVRSYEGRVTFVQQPFAPVPLPAGSLLLLSGLAGVAGLKRRKKVAA